MMEIADRYEEMVRRLVGGRPVILAGAVLASTTRRIAQLRELGAGPMLVVATGIGTGDLPAPEEAEHVLVEIRATDVMDEFRQVERLMAQPPPEIVAAIDAFDPDRTALVMMPPFSVSTALGDRPAYGARRPEWVALEDKTLCDALFDTVGVRRPPAEVVPAERAALLGAAARLDDGDGTVWAGDAREGFNGGGTFVRWIRPDASDPDVDEAVDRFGRLCDHVRVAPFLEGIPCSIHGFVCDDGVAVLRPVEMVNLRRPSGGRFQYAGAATYFDPPPADREAMRDAAGRVGAHLSAHHDFRGAFTVDGILTTDGWVPTELNSRYGGGLGYASVLHPRLPFEMVHHIVAAGDGSDVHAADVEALLLPAADEVRWGGGWSTVPTVYDATELVPVVRDDGRWRPATPGEEPDADLSRGPNAEGGFIRLALRPDRTPHGPSVAPLVAGALALADELFGAGIGPLTPPRRVR